MGDLVVAVYRPKRGSEKQKQLIQCVRDHVPILRRQGLATDFEPLVMRAADGSLIEIFEWASQDAIGRAHSNPEVAKLWDRFAECSTNISLADLEEAGERFPTLEQVKL